MHQLFAIGLAGLLMGACSQKDNVSPEVKLCAAKLYHDYNPKNLSQCISVCQTCSNGVQATCSTSCTLKGAT